MYFTKRKKEEDILDLNIKRICNTTMTHNKPNKKRGLECGQNRNEKNKLANGFHNLEVNNENFRFPKKRRNFEENFEINNAPNHYFGNFGEIPHAYNNWQYWREEPHEIL